MQESTAFDETRVCHGGQPCFRLIPHRQRFMSVDVVHYVRRAHFPIVQQPLRCPIVIAARHNQQSPFASLAHPSRNRHDFNFTGSDNETGPAPRRRPSRSASPSCSSFFAFPLAFFLCPLTRWPALLACRCTAFLASDIVCHLPASRSTCLPALCLALTAFQYSLVRGCEEGRVGL